MAHLEFFPEVRIQLANEIRVHHPDLKMKLMELPHDEWEMKLAEIAAHCGVLLDGEYRPSELDHLCEQLLNKLVASRKVIAQKIGDSKNEH